MAASASPAPATNPAFEPPTTLPVRAAARAGARVRGPVTIPTVRGLPILGAALEFRHDRLGLLGRLARMGPVARYHLGPIPVHVISDPELVHLLFVENPDAIIKSAGLSIFLRPLLGNGLLTAEGPVHKRHRKLLAPAFAPKRIATYAQAMAAESERTAAELALRGGSTLDVAGAMMEMTLAIAGRTLFGADVRGDARVVAEALTDAMESMVDSLASPIQLPYSFPLPRHLRMRRAVAALDGVVYRLIADRRASGADLGDVLSMLLVARDEDDGTGMTDRQVRDEVMTLLLAGHETTANALTWAFSLLGRHPEARAGVEAEADALGRAPTGDDVARLPYTLQVIEEAMRLWPPAYALGRQTVRDVEVGGYHFPAGAIVIGNVWGLHHQPYLYPEPQRFDPERFTPEAKKARVRGAYLPFGTGPRVCIGNHFALLEAQLALAALARTVRFEPTSATDPVGEPLVTLRPRGGLPMRVIARRGRA